VLIPSADLGYLSGFLKGFIAPAVELGWGRGNADDFIEGAKLDLFQFWAIRRLNEPTQAVLVTEIVDYPHKKALSILLCAGSGLWEWKHCINDLEAFARAEGCDQVEIPGREGWGRVYKDYTKAYSVFIKELGYGI
jgi:hypothetical protein